MFRCFCKKQRLNNKKFDEFIKTLSSEEKQKIIDNYKKSVEKTLVDENKPLITEKKLSITNEKKTVINEKKPLFIECENNEEKILIEAKEMTFEQLNEYTYYDFERFRLQGFSVGKACSIYDGDTITAIIYHEKLGPIMIEVRLFGIDTAELVPRVPKMNGVYYEVKIDSEEKLEQAIEQRNIEIKKAKNARNYLIKLLTDIDIYKFLNNNNIKTLKQEKLLIKKIINDHNSKPIYIEYGKVKAKYSGRHIGEIYLDKEKTISVSDLLIKNGHAVSYLGKTKEKNWGLL